ncbi:MAG TPA: hypothetical protein VEW28_03595 [Candidatus Kapabacteria bacterium]|nr:hypothetical protein [Candidatus Kapabacteria bacterium]
MNQATKNFSRLLVIAALLIIASRTFAQGGIGKMPREDLVMLSAVIRDSLADEMFARINDLKRFALANNADSAAPLVAFNTGAGRVWAWTRACDQKNPDDAKHVADVLSKLKKFYTDYPGDMHQEYFAMFKSKDTPSGQLLHYQIDLTKGNKKRMVSFHFYPVGDKLLYGDAN